MSDESIERLPERYADRFMAGDVDATAAMYEVLRDGSGEWRFLSYVFHDE